MTSGMRSAGGVFPMAIVAQRASINKPTMIKIGTPAPALRLLASITDDHARVCPHAHTWRNWLWEVDVQGCAEARLVT